MKNIKKLLSIDEFINQIYESKQTKGRIIDNEFVYAEDGTKINVKELMSEIKTAYALVSAKYPFFAEGLYSLQTIYTWMVPTMATDGTRLFINPKFGSELTVKEKVFVLTHEVLHCLLDHMTRMKGKDQLKFNKAADYEINGLLVSDNVLTESDIRKIKGLYDTKYLGMTVETIYNTMGSETKGKNDGGRGQQGDGQQGDGQQGDGQYSSGNDPLSDNMHKNNSGGGGEVISQEDGAKIAKESGYNDAASTKKETTKGKWENIAIKNISKMQGSVSGNHLRNAILERYKAAVNWRAELVKYIGKIASSTFSKMGRKRYIKDDILKSYNKEKLDDLERIVFLIDTSGSVNDEQIKILLSETQHIVEAKGAKIVAYVYFDSDVASYEIIKKNKKPNIKMIKGGGGTNFNPPFDWIKEKFKDDVDLVIMFTDGYANDPSKKPRYHRETIWVIYDNIEYTAPFGKTINISLSDIKK